jgi:ribonuclease HI
MKWAYTACIKPIFLYGAIIWGRALTTQRKEIKTMQRSATMQLGNFKPSTPGDALDVIVHLMPLDLSLQLEVIKSYLRNIEHINLNWKGISISGRQPGLIKYAEGLRDEYDISLCPFDAINPKLLPTCRYRVDPDSFRDGSGAADPDNIQIYTDGSKMAEGAGFGTVIQTVRDMDLRIPNDLEREQFKIDNQDTLFKRLSYSAGPDATVYQAETAALGNACQDIQQYWDLNPPNFPKKITFFVDNQAVLLALQKRHTRSALLLDTAKKLNVLGLSAQITIKWVRAHAGTLGNELADDSAKFGAMASPDMVAPTLPLAKSEMIRHIKDKLTKKWKDRWDSNPACRMSKILWSTINFKKSQSMLEWPRLDYSRAIRHITGHSHTRYHRSIVDKGITPKVCRHCTNADETSEHLILECPRFNQIRNKYFGFPIPTSNSSIWSLQSFRRVIMAPLMAEQEEDPTP